MTGECERKGRWFGGCNFQPRYDLSELHASGFTAEHIPASCFRDLLDAQRRKTYVRDVCETCGKTIERNTKAG